MQVKALALNGNYSLIYAVHKMFGFFYIFLLVCVNCRMNQFASGSQHNIIYTNTIGLVMVFGVCSVVCFICSAIERETN